MTVVLSFKTWYRIAGQRLPGLNSLTLKTELRRSPNTDPTLCKNAKPITRAEVNVHKFSTPVLNSRWAVCMTLRPFCSWGKGNFTCNGEEMSAQKCQQRHVTLPGIKPQTCIPRSVITDRREIFYCGLCIEVKKSLFYIPFLHQRFKRFNPII
jgi:hypothetical protein